MSPEIVSAIISACGFLLSFTSAAFISGYRGGNNKARLDMLEMMIQNAATKEQLAGVKEDLAEIKGMFTMKLRSEGNN